MTRYDVATYLGAVVSAVGLGAIWWPLGVVWLGVCLIIVGVIGAVADAYKDDSTDEAGGGTPSGVD